MLAMILLKSPSKKLIRPCIRALIKTYDVFKNATRLAHKST